MIADVIAQVLGWNTQWVEDSRPHTSFLAKAILKELVAKRNTRSPVWGYSGFKRSNLINTAHIG